MIVDGQVHGGIAHGIGNALFEWMGYDESRPAGDDEFRRIPAADRDRASRCSTTRYKQTPSPLNPLGAKGAGEVGTIPAAAAIISAIEDALKPFGVRIAQVPDHPARLVELIAAARHAGGIDLAPSRRPWFVIAGLVPAISARMAGLCQPERDGRGIRALTPASRAISGHDMRI